MRPTTSPSTRWDTFQHGFTAIWHAYSRCSRARSSTRTRRPTAPSPATSGPISETLTNATPLILGGLSVGLAFRAGLFNIGGQGQIIMGAIFAGYVGFAWHLPPGLHLLVAVVAGMLGGALWGGLAGLLKARTGAHEVITTIMLNYVAVYFLGYLLSVKGFQAPPYGQAISNRVFNERPAAAPARQQRARPRRPDPRARWPPGSCWWLLEPTTLGFRLRAVGANQFAARTAGMSVARSYITVMLISGALSGLAGRQPDPRHQQPADRRHRRRHRLRRDHRRAARPGQPRGHRRWPACCSARSRPAAPRCSRPPARRSTWCSVIQALIVLFIAAPR